MKKIHILISICLFSFMIVSAAFGSSGGEGEAHSSGISQLIWPVINFAILVIILFIWMGWNFILMSLDLIRTKTVTPVFRMPFYPISFGLAFCCLLVYHNLHLLGKGSAMALGPIFSPGNGQRRRSHESRIWTAGAH